MKYSILRAFPYKTGILVFVVLPSVKRSSKRLLPILQSLAKALLFIYYATPFFKNLEILIVGVDVT